MFRHEYGFVALILTGRQYILFRGKPDRNLYECAPDICFDWNVK